MKHVIYSILLSRLTRFSGVRFRYLCLDRLSPFFSARTEDVKVRPPYPLFRMKFFTAILYACLFCFIDLPCSNVRRVRARVVHAIAVNGCMDRLRSYPVVLLHRVVRMLIALCLFRMAILEKDIFYLG